MAKVLFVNPIVRQEDVPRHIPYGIALLAAIAIEKGHLVQVFDQNAWRKGPNIMREVCQADAWDVIAMGGITTAYNSMKELMKIAGEECPNALIVLGGGILTSLAKEMMDWIPQVDIGVIGEAFSTWPEILEEVDNKSEEWSKIDGLIYRGKNGRLHYTKPRDLLEDLDSLPYPAWDLFPLEEVYFPNSTYINSEEGMMAKRRLDINASYGCSLICRFCYHLGIAGDMRYTENENGDTQIEFDQPGNYSRTIRYHSPEYTVKMVKHIHEKYGVDFVAFLDENLMTMHRYSRDTWLTDICRLWHEYGLVPRMKPDGSWKGVAWSGTSHASLCNPEILKIMAEAGCKMLIYGYESFSPHVLKTIGKGATRKHNIQSFFWTLEAGIRPIPNQIIGFPNDDFESLRTNVKAWDELGIMVKPHFATPYPGSEWFTVYRNWIEQQYGGDLEAFIQDLGDATDISATISHNFNAIELVGLREMMVQRAFNRIDEYEKIWRKNHGIPEGGPSTIYQEPKWPAAAE